MSNTTEAFLDNVARRCFMPLGQLTFTSLELLSMADEEMRTAILPMLISIQEEYCLFSKDQAVVANQAAYPVPARAVGLTAREVQLVRGDCIEDLNRLPIEKIVRTGSGCVDSFYMKGNDVVLYRTPGSADGTLRISFYLRPSDLVLSTDAAVISSINTVTNEVTVSNIPVTWVTGNVFDLIKKDGGHECRDIDLTSSLISGSVITLPSLPSALVAGDYVSLASTSPVIQLPPDFVSALAQKVASTVLGNMNQPGADNAEKKYNGMIKAIIEMCSPRIVGEITPILQTWF